MFRRQKAIGSYLGGSQPVSGDSIRFGNKPGSIRPMDAVTANHKVTASNSQRYMPNLERLDVESLIDEITPKTEIQLLKVFRNIRRQDSVVGPGLDMINNLPWSDLELSGCDTEAMKAYTEAVEMINPIEFMSPLTDAFLTDGKYVGSLVYDSDRGTFTDIITLDPSYLKLTPTPIRSQDPKVDITSSKEMRDYFSSRDPRDKWYLDQIGSGLKDRFVRGNMPLEPLSTIFVPRLNSLNLVDQLGTSLLHRVLPFYALEKALWNATISSARRRSRAITHLSVGIDGTWEPTPSDMETIIDLFMKAEEDPTGAYVVTRNGISANDIRQGGDFWKISDDIDMITTGKIRAIGINESLLSGEASFSTQEVALSVFIDNIKALRDEITNRFFFRKIFQTLARAHGFVKRTEAEVSHGVYKGTAKSMIERNDKLREQYRQREMMTRMNASYDPKSKLYRYSIGANNISLEESLALKYGELDLPQVHWHKQLTPESDAAYLEILNSLKEAGVPINLKTWASAGGLDIKKLIDGMDEDGDFLKTIKEKQKKYGLGGGGESEDESFASVWASASENNQIFGIEKPLINKVIAYFCKKENTFKLTNRNLTMKALGKFTESSKQQNALLYILNTLDICEHKVEASVLEEIGARLATRMRRNPKDKKVQEQLSKFMEIQDYEAQEDKEPLRQRMHSFAKSATAKQKLDSMTIPSNLYSGVRS